MKIYNKLFAIIIAMLGVTTLSAQTNIIADWDGGSNTGRPTSFGWTSSNTGRSWGTLNGSGARVSNTYSGYTKEDGSTYSYVADSEPSTQILWIRYNSTSETYTYTFSGLEAGKVYRFSGLVGWHNNSNAPTFTITVNGDKELAKVSKYCGTKQKLYQFSVDFYVPSNNTSENFTLKFNSNQGNDNMEALSGLSIAEVPEFTNASESTPYDATSWLKNPGFENGSSSLNAVNAPTDWKVTYDLAGWLDGNPVTDAPSEGNKCYNLWAGTVNSIDMQQTVYLPVGKYKVYADLRTDNVNNITNQGVYASVGGIVTKSDPITNVASTWNSLEGWNTLSATFSNGSEGDVIIGISSTGKGSGNAGWFQADNVRLEYLGFDLSVLNESLNSLIEAAQGIVTANEAAPKTIENLNVVISAAQSVEQNKDALEAVIANLSTAISTANATVTACLELRSYIALAEEMYEYSTADDKSAFLNAINQAKNGLSTATESAVINTLSADLLAAQKAYCLVASPAEGHPFDMTHLIVNPNFDDGTNGWAYNTGATNHGIATNQEGAITGKYYENWDWNSYVGSINQEITGLPNGTYQLTAAAFRDQLIDGASEQEAVYVFANDQYVVVNSTTPEFYTVEVAVKNGTLSFGIESKVKNYRWMGIDNVSLKFVAALDLSEFQTAYEEALAAAVAARDNAEYSVVTGLEKTNLLNAIAIVVEETKESYQEATSALTSATAAFIAAKGDYTTLAGEITIAKGLGMTDEQVDGVVANKTGVVAYQDLKVAEYNYIKETYTQTATLGSWTEDFAEDLDGEGYKAGGPKYLNEWGNATRTAKQTVKLPAGDYAISSIGRGQVGTSGYLYYKIGEGTNKVDFIMKGNRGRGVDVNGVANFSDTGEYNCNGEGFGWEYRFITFTLAEETEVEIGVSATFASAWVSIYAPMLYTTESAVKTLRLSEIASALSEAPSGKMNADVQAELTAAVTAAESASASNTIDELNVIASNLATAVAAAKTSVAAYDKLKKYIDMTKDFTDVATYESKYNNGEYTSDDVESVRRELNVVRFNAASEIFTNKVEVTGWTGALKDGEIEGQHWDGTSTTKYYDANSWTANYVGLVHTLSTELTLPAGSYVLKAAGRSSADATLSLSIKADENELSYVEYTGKGDTGKGIDTTGNANFSEEGTYALDNQGRGWEWEFAKFELDKETTVTLNVKCDYNDIQNRFGSFSDITLWMDDEAYVNVYGDAVNAPKSEAQALVDTKPMGTAENTALANAIAAAETKATTPAELNKQVEDLETAVAKAKAWVVEYNDAKAPLVAAFECFETDFNDGANGALRPMSDEAWLTLLEAVEVAAAAKDVTDSYDGFAQAAADFNAAMDAAEMEIIKFGGDATSLIKNADFTEGTTSYDYGNGQVVAPKEWTFNFGFDGWGDTKIIDGYLNVWAGGIRYADLSQTVNNLPNGTYKLSADIVTDANTNGDSWVAVYATPCNEDGIPNTELTARSKNVVQGEDGSVFANYEVYFNVEHGAAVIGVRTDKRYFKVKNFNLEYVSADAAKVANGILLQNVYVNRDVTSLDVTEVATDASGAEIYLNNPNAVIYANEGQVNWQNTVVNGEAESLVLTDGYEFNVTEDFTADAANYNRTFAQGTWLSVCVPFDFAIPEGVKVETLGEVNLAEKVFTFNEVTGTMEANTPYIIKNSTENAALFAALESVNVKATPADMTTAVEGTEFGSTYRTVTSTELMEEGAYDILFFGTDGQLYYLTEGSKAITFKPFRSYIRVERGLINWSDGVAARVRHSSDDFTGIDEVETDEEGEVVIYDLMGRRVTSMQKGRIYIVNGKKMLCK